jgi:plastocyanin
VRNASTNRFAQLLAVAVIAGLGIAACGDDNDGDPAADGTTTAAEADGTGAAGTTVDISAPASGDLTFDQADVTVPSGLVSLNFDNPSSTSHDLVVEDESGEEVARTDVVSDGEVATSTPLEPGVYTFYCSVDGHREAGMEGTLTVE